MSPLEAAEIIPSWLDGRDVEADERGHIQKLTTLIAAWLDGRGRGADDNGELARGVVEQRVSACLRQEGQTWLALAKHDPKRFLHWAEGTVRAVRRALLVKAGHVSRQQLGKLWNQELHRRAGVAADDLSDGFEDPLERQHA